uniref:Carbonic anhydrase n=1 Tax=Xenopus tropicalis TaxID=8364 RepID=A0A6I8QPZ5_XENTR
YILFFARLGLTQGHCLDGARQLMHTLCFICFTGPRNWKHIYSECDGLQQSPVNIKTKNTTYNSLLRPFQFKGYNVTHTLPITNNGHSVQVDLPTQAHISGGGLSGVYKAKQLHFHWGSAGVAGSEHTVDGERYLMELHVVHRRNAMNEENISISNEDLAVLGFFFEVRGLPYELLQPYSIKEQFFSLGDTTCLNLTLQEFIPEPKDLALYYRYQGSLTTPPCSEIVTWTLFTKTIKLSRRQVIHISYLVVPYSGEFYKNHFNHIEKERLVKIVSIVPLSLPVQKI